MFLFDIARSLRNQRLATIRTERPSGLAEGSVVVLHAIPVRRDPHAINLDIHRVNRDDVRPLRGGCQHRYDFEGLFAVVPGAKDTSAGYALLFRNGILEATDTSLLRAKTCFPGGPPCIPSTALEAAVINAARRFVQLQRRLSIAPQIALGLSLLGVKGMYVGVSDRYAGMDGHTIVHDDLIFPEVYLRQLEDDPMDALRPTFDQLWNAGGMPACADYDDQALQDAIRTSA
jgi:hypothetical protein